MIILEGVTALVATKKSSKAFLSDVDLILPSNRRIALLGTGREETVALMHLLSGLLPPRAGRVIRQSKVSFPVGFLGGFVADLPVRENVAYLSRLYDADADAILTFMRKATRLGAVFATPYGQLPRDAKADLAQILAYALPFDIYLLLQQPKAPAGNGTDATYELFQARRRAAGMIIPTASQEFAHAHCELGLVFEKGKLRLYNKLDDAFSKAQPEKGAKHEAAESDPSEDDPGDDVSLTDTTLARTQDAGAQPKLTKEERRLRRRRSVLREKRRSGRHKSGKVA